MKNKIWTVFKREYLSRLFSKGFIIGTFLAPLGIIALIGVSVGAAVFLDDDAQRSIAVVDETGVLQEMLEFPKEYDITASTLPLDSLRVAVQRDELSGYLVLPASLLEGEGEATYYSKGGGGFSFQIDLRDTISDAVRAQRLKEAAVSEEIQAIFKNRPQLKMLEITDAGDQADSTGLFTAVGYFMGFMIYMAVLLYGSFVMRSVIEEKSSRIVEVIVSSVRPYQLMMGKVLGMGALGVTQFVLWSVVMITLSTFGGSILMLFLSPENLNIPEVDTASQQEILDAMGFSLPVLPVSLFFFFIIFFLGGYLLYASLFAAVGASVDQESDAQQFVLPITLLIIVPIMFLGFVLGNPDGSLAVILSLIPFFSPVLMPARIAITTVPLWQSGLSILFLILAFMGSIWISARIYRVGILMYGKKPTFKDIFRWLRYA